MQYQIQKNRIFSEDATGTILAEINFPETESGTCTIVRTFVDDSLRGQGIAGQLVQKAVKTIIQQGCHVSATCSYARHWLEKYSVRTVTVLRILDEDYGCEGVPDGEEPMCRVLVRDKNSTEFWIKIPDSYLTKNAVREGDMIEEFFSLLR